MTDFLPADPFDTTEIGAGIGSVEAEVKRSLLAVKELFLADTAEATPREAAEEEDEETTTGEDERAGSTGDASLTASSLANVALISSYLLMGNHLDETVANDRKNKKNTHTHTRTHMYEEGASHVVSWVTTFA